MVAADSQKFGRTAMCKVFEPRDYDLIISDSGIDKKRARRLARLKINMELA